MMAKGMPLLIVQDLTPQPDMGMVGYGASADPAYVAAPTRRCTLPAPTPRRSRQERPGARPGLSCEAVRF
jgi:hypothetical protein